MFDPSKAIKKMLGPGVNVPRFRQGRTAGDMDGDGISDIMDCQPKNMFRQDGTSQRGHYWEAIDRSGNRRYFKVGYSKTAEERIGSYDMKRYGPFVSTKKVALDIGWQKNMDGSWTHIDIDYGTRQIKSKTYPKGTTPEIYKPGNIGMFSQHDTKEKLDTGSYGRDIKRTLIKNTKIKEFKVEINKQNYQKYGGLGETSQVIRHSMLRKYPNIVLIKVMSAKRLKDLGDSYIYQVTAVVKPREKTYDIEKRDKRDMVKQL